MNGPFPSWLKVNIPVPHQIVDVNVYDNETYGSGIPGAAVAAYDVMYGVHPNEDADPVIHVLVEGWYPPGMGDDHWLDPVELPRRIRRALIKEGAIL